MSAAFPFSMQWCGVHHSHAAHVWAQPPIGVYTQCPGSTCACVAGLYEAPTDDDLIAGTEARTERDSGERHDLNDVARELGVDLSAPSCVDESEQQ